MIKKVANLYEDIVRPGCSQDLKRIAMWTAIIVIVLIVARLVGG